MDLTAEETEQPQRGYLELLRENPNFRRLWLGQVVSQLGDWFNTIALYAVTLKLTNSEQALALILVTRFLSTVFSSPLAGVIADRFNRKKVMIAADLARAVVVLGFLFIRRPEDVWLIYFLTILQLVLSTLFEPARSASIPSVVEPKDLLTANGITAVTWSAMLTLGAALGGFATAALGTDAAFILDSATYLLSAVLFLGLNLPPRLPREKQKLTVFRATGLEDVYEGLKYVWHRPRILAAMLAKPAQSIAGGTLTLLAIYGEKVFPIAGSGEIGIGVLYGVRGIGTALAPIVVQRFVRGSRRSLENSLGAAFFIVGTFFALFGTTENYALAVCLLLIAYAAGSLVWMNSTALMQKYVEDQFRGRVFAAELCLLTLMLAGSNYAVGALLDDFNFSLRQVTIGTGLVVIIPGVIWFVTRKFWQTDDRFFMKNQINAFFTAKEIRLEDFDNEVWLQADSVKINRYWSGDPAPAERAGIARILWSENRLFVRFDCRQAEPFVISRNPNLEAESAKLWERDVCEIFLAPDMEEAEKYFEFEVAPTGEWLDFAIRQLPEKRETDKTYDAGMKTAARIEENSFTVIFSVEFERAFGRKPEAGEVWRTNLFRCVGSGETRGYLAWQPTFTEEPGFHIPAVFGSLKFTK